MTLWMRSGAQVGEEVSLCPLHKPSHAPTCLSPLARLHSAALGRAFPHPLALALLWLLASEHGAAVLAVEILRDTETPLRIAPRTSPRLGRAEGGGPSANGVEQSLTVESIRHIRSARLAVNETNRQMRCKADCHTLVGTA